VATSLLKKIGRAAEPETAGGYVRASEGWTVEIYPDLDDKLKPGEIEVHSELGAPEKAEYAAGSMTTTCPIMPECCVPQYSAQNR